MRRDAKTANGGTAETMSQWYRRVAPSGLLLWARIGNALSDVCTLIK